MNDKNITQYILFTRVFIHLCFLFNFLITIFNIMSLKYFHLFEFFCFHETIDSNVSQLGTSEAFIILEVFHGLLEPLILMRIIMTLPFVLAFSMSCQVLVFIVIYIFLSRCYPLFFLNTFFPQIPKFS